MQPKKIFFVFSDNDTDPIVTTDSYKAAVYYLIYNEWITADFEVQTEKYKWVTVKEFLGENWINVLLNEMDCEEFNDLFRLDFSINEDKLYTIELIKERFIPPTHLTEKELNQLTSVNN